jgi:outer membrane protein TolC
LGGADDVLTAQTAKGGAVIAVVQARTNEDAARVSLLQTMGLDPQTPITLTEDSLDPILFDGFDAYVAQALERRPEILRAKAAIDAAKFGARAAKTTSAPTLSSTVSFSTSDPGYPAGGAGYGVGLILSVPLFDGHLQAGVVEQANAALKSAQSDLVTTQLQVRTDVSQAFLSSKGAEQLETVALTNLANAKESLRIAEGRYKAGLGLFLDVINAQAALLAAETSAATASSEVLLQRAALKRAGGLLTEN